MQWQQNTKRLSSLLQLVSTTPRFIKANHTSAAAPLGEIIMFSMRSTEGTRGCHVAVSVWDRSLQPQSDWRSTSFDVS